MKLKKNWNLQPGAAAVLPQRLYASEAAAVLLLVDSQG